MISYNIKIKVDIYINDLKKIHNFVLDFLVSEIYIFIFGLLSFERGSEEGRGKEGGG